MRFDDRLTTVLNQPASDPRDIAVRWRQLVDLVARAGSSAASAGVAQALQVIRDDAPNVEPELRAAAARAVAALPLPLALLEFFASDRPQVAAPVLAAATLSPGQWQAILGSADEDTAAFIKTLHPNLVPDAPVEPSPTPAEREATPSLHDVVERIERRREARSGARQQPGRPAQAEAVPALFRWECGPGGDIAWVDGVPRGPLIGRSLARVQDRGVERAFAMRAPFRDALLSIPGEGAIAGEWKISGVPAFEPADGRFAGYRGIALRERPIERPEPAAAELLSDPASVRELVHEIRTPLNAIIGFAEIIEGQLLGPADEEYRARAHEIVRQARLLLTAVQDLDFAAKVHSAATDGQRSVAVGELVEGMVGSLRELGLANGVEIDATRALGGTSAATEPELAERLIFRMCSAVIGEATNGERLRLTVDSGARGPCVSISRPDALKRLPDRQLLSGEKGFTLRLIQGLARIAGAEVAVSPAAITLLFPSA